MIRINSHLSLRVLEAVEITSVINTILPAIITLNYI